VLLNAGLSGGEGLNLCRQLRDRGGIVIVMMADQAVQAEPVDRVVGLDLGAAIGDSDGSVPQGDRGIDLQVSRLLQKLGDDPLVPQWIRTVRGKGYLFEPHRLGIHAAR